jgi:hypothetical protein
MSHRKSLWIGLVLVVCAGMGPVLHAQAKPGPASGQPSPSATTKQPTPAVQKPSAAQTTQAKPAVAKTQTPAQKPAAKQPSPAAPKAQASAQKPAAKQPAPAVQKPAATSPAQAKAAPAKSQPVAHKRPAKPVSRGPAKEAVAKKPSAKKPPAQEAKGAAATAGAPGEAAPTEAEVKVARRDPFESLIGRQRDSEAIKNLPPGKAGLMISALRLDGVVRAPNGMIAVVTNPQQRTYFLRDGDQLYDGRVDKISMDNVSFHEVGKDAFGKPIERQVDKRIYPSPGEQQ